ncbi:phosphoserine phosphatase [Klebsiella pneumoniae]|uniref:Phosphoserine phosphatase n=1 Tax=Klebsiella pneumoniae TaxID=573 RepID=A0A2X3ESK9_KLEPN|nr:phosphoserine phosphatase [Klebsiella pneumoniae]
MRGELDFTASLRQRVATLKDADASILLQVRDALPLMPGLAQLVLKLETLGWKVAIASGGFTFFAEYLRDKLHLDAVFANELEIRDGKLTATCSAISSMRNIKPIRLRKLAEKYEIPTAQTVAIGDGANDLPMIKAAGLGIAYHAKPKVNEQAEVTIRHADLMGVFCILSGSMNQK